MNLQNAQALAELLIEQHLGQIKDADGNQKWTFAWHNYKRRFGTCDYVASEIQLSRCLTEHETEDATEQTILHEIAHAKCPGQGHNRIWKATAAVIGVRNPRATRVATAESIEDGPTPTWVMVFGKEIVQKYYRKPGTRTFASLKRRYVRNRRTETLGKLEILPYAAYLKIK